MKNKEIRRNEIMDWTNIGDQLVDILLPLLATFLTGLFTYIGTRLKTVYEQKVTTDTAKTVVADVVQFVQQVYKDLDGEEKLQKALTEASTILTEKGITISQTELNMLIESSVYGIKQGTKTEETKTITDTTSKDTNVSEEEK